MNKERFNKEMMILAAMTFVAAVISLACYCAARFGNMTTETMSFGIITSLFMLPMPMLTRVIVLWSVEYFASINSTFRGRIKEKIVTHPLDPEKDDFLNSGIIWALTIGIWGVWGAILALFNMIVKLRIFYTKKIFLFFESLTKFVGSSWDKMLFFVWFVTGLALLVWIFILVRQAYVNLNAEAKFEKKPYNWSSNAGWFLVFFVIKKVFNYFYYGFSLNMIFIDMLIWAIIAIIVFILYSKIVDYENAFYAGAGNANDDDDD